MTETRWALYALDGSFQRAAPLHDFEGEVVLRNNKPGSWSLSFDYSGAAKTWLRFLGLGSGIAVARNDQPVFVGILEERTVEEGSSGTTLTCSGRDALILLEDRWVDPIGGTGVALYDTQAYDYQTGPIQTLMRHYFAVNVAQGVARVDRQVSGLTQPATDSGLGGSATVRGRFDNLLTLLQGLAAIAEPQETGLRFWIEESEDGLEFQIGVPRDLRNDVIFDFRKNNVAGSRLTERAPTVSAIAIAGSGVEPKRPVHEFTDGGEITEYGRRIERFIDGRDNDNASELAEKALKELRDGQSSLSVAITPISDTPYQFIRDYNVGDWVSGYVSEIPFNGIIQEVRISFSSSGTTVEPMIGTEDASFDTDSRTGRAISSIQDRILFLERTNQFGAVGMVIGWRGDIGEIPVGWRLCNGDTLPNGYVLADYRDKFLVGAGGVYDIGDTGGSATANLSHNHVILASALAHGHNILASALSHGHTDSGHAHTSQAHTHPGSHSHGIGSHTHSYSHTHQTDIDHDHPATDTGQVNVDTVAVGNAAYGSGTTSHHHSFNMPALGATLKTTSSQSTSTTGGGSGSTDPDSDTGTFAASYTGSPDTENANVLPGQPATDVATQNGQPLSNPSTEGALSSVSILPPFVALAYIERVPS